jgi:hypothetical protein
VSGSSIPVKFSLGGNQGLAIFAAGYPVSSPVPCDASEPGAVIEETVNAGGSSLSYILIRLEAEPNLRINAAVVRARTRCAAKTAEVSRAGS